MSISLVIIRLETANNYPQLQHIQFRERSESLLKQQEKTGTVDTKVVNQTSEWPLLVSDTLLAIHRGQRKPTTITVTSLDASFIEKEMSAIDQTRRKAGEGDGEQEEEEEEEEEESQELPAGDEDPMLEEESGEKKEDSLGALVSRFGSKESTPAASSSKEGTPGPSDDASQASGCSARSSSARGGHRIPFMSGNPTVDVTRGILHLYKQNTKTSLSAGEERSSMVCMLSVPSSLTIHDLLQFTAPCYCGILHIRVIRDSSPNQFMVLIKFKSQTEADEFYTNFNEKPYNSLEPDVLCRLVYVTRVETTAESKEGGLPIPGHTELPTCPVCLERMDESVDGVLTILCNHSFHGECLAKWGDTSCPVCRYCQTVEAEENQVCSQCGARDSLWICLICGHVGCGRYVGGHAHRHFVETNHLFSMQLGNNRVWDYVRDNYVHRLLQSEGDGKVVSYERVGDSEGMCRGGDCDSNGGGGGGSDCSTKEELLLAGEEKLSSLQLEYTHLLSSQLETQRLYFEDKITELASTATAEADNLRQTVQQLKEELSELTEQVSVLLKEKQLADKRLQQMQAKHNK
ncbi:BRCA1-associated 2, partial [Trinorchestia longiramus]